MTSSHKGYYFDKRRDSYVVRAQVNGKRQYLGSFKSESLTAEAYQNYSTTGVVPVMSAVQIEHEEATDPVWHSKKPSWWSQISAKLYRKKLERQMDKHLEKVNKP